MGVFFVFACLGWCNDEKNTRIYIETKNMRTR